MTINEKIVRNIFLILEKMDKDDNFKERFSNISSLEYFYQKLQPFISTKRIVNILNGKSKRITLEELIHIANALNVHLYELVK